MNPRERLQYALYLQRLQDLFVIKENIAFEYQHKNYNKAAKQIDIAVDKMLHDNVVNAVDGTLTLKNPKVDHIIEEALVGQQNMLVKNPDHYIRNAVEQNTKDFSNFLQNRIEIENYSLQKKIQDEYDKRKNEKISDEQLKKEIKEKYIDHGRKRAKNIVKDALHTNQSHMSWVSSREGYKYKVWMNGQSKSGVRSWHIKSKIQPVEIDDFFDIFSPTRRPAQMMYPGDLNGGAENVANCKCWLYYTNIAPSNLKPRGTIQVNPNVNLTNENSTTYSANTETKGKRTKIASDKSTSSNENKVFTKIKTRISKIGKKIKTTFYSKIHNSYLSSKKFSDDGRVIIEEHNGNKFKDYRNVPDDFDEHMENLQKDVKYKSEHIKATQDYGGEYYTSINDYCYKNKSLEKSMEDNRLTLKEVEQKIKDLDGTIEVSPGLDDNYILWKGGDSRGIDLNPGAKNKWAAYSSTSADRDVAEDYYSGRKEYLEKEDIDAIPLLFKIRAKTGTKGVYLDDRMQATTGEYEFLLGREQEFTVIESYPNPDDPEMIICEIELL